MNLIYKYSKFNNDLMEFATGYNRKPTVNEIKKSRDNNNKYIAEDGLIVFAHDTFCEVRMIVGNDLAVNRYNDVYSIR